MTTISVPLSKEHQESLDHLVKSGVAPNRAAVMRKALERLAEEEAIEDVLRAEREVSQGKVLKGNTRTLLGLD